MEFSGIQPFTAVDYPGKIACIVFTAGCNFRCGFCHNPEFVLLSKIEKIKESFIDEETVFRFLEKRKGLLQGVVITGGEPTIHPGLTSFITRVKEMGFSVKLDSNGYRPNVIQQLLDAELIDYIAMDIKGDREQYQELVEGCTNVEHLEKSVEFIMYSSIPYEFRTTLIKEIHTPPVLENIGQWISGAQNYYLQDFRPEQTLQPVYQTYHSFSQEEYTEAVSILNKYINNVTIRTTL